MSTLILDMQKSEDPTLTCFICDRVDDPTDLCIQLRPAYNKDSHMGKRVWVGAHSHCASYTQALNDWLMDPELKVMLNRRR